MLVLSRKIGDEIVIGGCIRVKVVAVHGSRVRLGIVADESIAVHRAEVKSRIDEFHNADVSDSQAKAIRSRAAR